MLFSANQGSSSVRVYTCMCVLMSMLPKLCLYKWKRKNVPELHNFPDQSCATPDF